MSDKTITEDDIRLTAYAIGEMDADEAAQFEQLLADAPEARAEIDAIRAMGETLTGEFAHELAAVESPALTLVEPDVEAPAIAGAGDTGNVARPRFWVFGTVATGLAAMFMVAVFVRQGGMDQTPAMFEAATDKTVPAGDATPGLLESANATEELDGKEAGKLMGNSASGDGAVAANEMPVLADAPVGGALPADASRTESKKEDLLASVEEQVRYEQLKAKPAPAAAPKPAPVSRPKPAPAPPAVATPPAPVSGDSTAGRSNGLAAELTDADRDAKPGNFRRLAAVADEAAAVASSPVQKARPEAAAWPMDPFDSPATSVTPATLSQTRGKAATSFGIAGETDATAAAMPGAKDIHVTAGARIVVRSGSNGGNSYAPLIDNVFKDPLDEELSTFSIDVDTASYSQLRRTLLRNGRWPHRDQVRIEELINYFDYDYPAPDLDDVEDGHAAPFAVSLEEGAAPWASQHRLVRIGLKSAEIKGERPPANLVFLVDVSGSMSSADKLGLVQKSLRELVPQLGARDRVTMVAYAGRAGEVLEPTAGDDHDTIGAAIDALSAGGSTNGAGGIKVAYQRARENFVEGGVNRVILATDGDFNVGVSSDEELVKLVENRARSGVFLTVLGFGSGNLNDAMMEKITNKGNGNYFYIDGIDEGKKVLVEQMAGTLVTVAKDVKIQVDFNPAKVASYRLIGYANRILNREDFDNDKVDAGEIGAGLTVTALYEVVPVGVAQELTGTQEVEGLKYQRRLDVAGEQDLKAKRQEELADRGVELVESNELLTVKLRYKRPTEDESTLLEFPLVERRVAGREAKPSDDFSFASAVAAFGMRLRHSRYIDPEFSLEAIAEIAVDGKGEDPSGRRAQFIEMVRLAAASEPGANEDVRRAVRERLERLR